MDGILRINKAKGLTSHDVVGRVRRILGQKEVGHAGTLDPMAEGLMILLLGEATKISDYILNGDKAYRARVKMGTSTDTWDMDGEVLATQDVSFTETQFQDAILKLKGDFNWQVPKFSAIKKQGQKLYEKARKGEEFEAPTRPMSFKSIEFIECTPDEVEVQLLCSKGSYIRTWGQELGRLLGVPSCLSALTRNFSEPYSLHGALKLEELENLENLESHEAFLPLNKCLAHFPGISLKGRELTLMKNGQVPNALVRRLVPLQKECNRSEAQQIVRVFDASNMNLVALLEARPCSPIRVRRGFKTP